MAGIGEQEDVQLLRAIAHARMYVTSGRGLESVVYSIVAANVGRASDLLKPALERMTDGEAAEFAVRNVLEKEEDPHMRSFLSALIAAGKPGIMRLDELSASLHAERENKAEVYGTRLAGIVDMTAALFVLAFLPTIARKLTKIPQNPIVPNLNLPDAFEPVFYAILAMVMTGLLLMARVK